NDPTQAKRNEFEELYASANEELYPSYSNTPRKKVPKKVLRYFPIIPRLQRLYKSSHTAKEMTWHATGKCTEPGKMQHPVDGKAWKDIDTKYSDFAAETRNVRLGLAADGFNPFGNLSQSYSMWPVILTIYNLPLWLCMKESYFMLTLLIPGPKSSGKDIDVYLRSLIDDLKVLWAKPSVETINVATGLKFNMRAMVLWTINDFPARSSLSGPLIDDLKVLWAKPGVETIDVATGLKFNMRAMVLWTINDFPDRSSLSGWSGQGYKACPTCNEDTPSVRVLGKTAYVGHRRFLKKPHKWRRSLEYNGETKNGYPPREFSRDAIMTQLAIFPMRVKGKHPRLGIRSGLWLGQNKKGKCLKPQAAYSFTPEDKKKFCQFNKGVKLPDGFGSNFKHKFTDNDTNITGLKSHDCHIMMQRLLPYGLQQYLAPDIAKPLIELCLFFKQICSQTLMVDDMLKAQSKRLFLAGPIRPRWMYPFERYMKKLKNYVRNKAKPEGSIAEGYVAEEALTFSSHYFWDVTTKFNRPDRNVDCPPPTCQLQVFKSLCKSIGLWSVIRIDPQELKKVIWYVLHNNPEIDTYRAKFKMYIHQRHLDNDPGVNESSELFALACGPSQTPISVNSCVVNGVRFVVHSRDERRITQNSNICSPGLDREMYYEDDPDVIHVDNSSDLALSTSLNDLEITALHIDGQYVDAPLDIIDVVDEDDDIIDEEDPIPHDLADSDDEDPVNLHIDDGVNISTNVARGHGSDGGRDDRPPPYQVPTGYRGCLGNRGKGTRKPNLGGRRAGRLHTRQETRNLRLKAITNKSGLVLIWFEVDDQETLMPLGDHAAHWANYHGELVRKLPLHYPSWCQMPPERKARVVEKIGHLPKIYNGKKAALKQRYWVPKEDGSYDLEGIRRARPSHISEADWDAQLAF
nr:hypothetical protein [Tanacetum cinerariifolium]